ncbi:MAG TPA: alpha/beta hydrolase [Verrucomicrobiae bacterium]|nr:alpha/beta hydrolase [Verrucomicrobiae bacterium]
MQVVVKSLLTSYVRIGRGRPVLILHGWGDTGRSWYGFAEQLAKHYEVIVPDLPGFGDSQTPQEVWSLDDYAVFVSAFTRKVGVQPYAVIGHSNGGAIAIQGITTSRMRSERLVLLASSGIRGEDKGRRTAWKIVAKTGKAIVAPLPTSTKQKLRRKLYRAAGSDMLVAEHLQETFKNVVGQDMRHVASEVDVPTLLVYGEADTDTPPHYGELLAAAIHGSQFKLLPSTGHFLQIDSPTEVLQLVEDFLQ